MFVCLCNPVTENQIRFCATDGCASFREMAAKLGVAQQCGRCACHAKEVFDLARDELPLTRKLNASSRTRSAAHSAAHMEPRTNADATSP